MSGFSEQAFNWNRAQDEMAMRMDADAVAFADTWAAVFANNAWQFGREATVRGGGLWSVL